MYIVHRGGRRGERERAHMYMSKRSNSDRVQTQHKKIKKTF